MAKTVDDVALMMDGLVGYDERDPMSIIPDVENFCQLKAIDLSNLRVGWTTDFSGKAPLDDRIRKTFINLIDLMEGLFCTFKECEFGLNGIRDGLWSLRCQYYLVNHLERVRQHRELLSKNIVANVEAGLNMSLLDGANAEKVWAKVYREFQKLFEKIDLLIVPGNAVPPFLVNEGIPKKINGELMENYVDASLIRSIITLSGNPVIAIPSGLDHLGLPFGLQVVGKRHWLSVLWSVRWFACWLSGR